MTENRLQTYPTNPVASPDYPGYAPLTRDGLKRWIQASEERGEPGNMRVLLLPGFTAESGVTPVVSIGNALMGSVPLIDATPENNVQRLSIVLTTGSPILSWGFRFRDAINALYIVTADDAERYALQHREARQIVEVVPFFSYLALTMYIARDEMKPLDGPHSVINRVYVMECPDDSGAFKHAGYYVWEDGRDYNRLILQLREDHGPRLFNPLYGK